MEGPGENNPEFEGRQLEREDNINKRYTKAGVFLGSTVHSDTSVRGPELRCQKHRGRVSRFCLSFWRIFNRFLKVVHWAMSVMFIAGAITLALSYRFTNPYVT